MWDYAGQHPLYSCRRESDGRQKEGWAVTSSRIILRLALGILCGVALVMVPAVFSTGTPNPSSNPSGKTVQPSQLTASPALYGLNSSGIDGMSLLVIILFIFLPSTIFSLLVRRWAEKRARDHLRND